MIRGVLFNFVFFTVNAVWLTICLPILVLPERYIVRYTEGWSVLIMWIMRICAGIRYEIRGLENLPASPCIIACKHQSGWDTIIFHQVCKHPALIMKKELTWLPVYSWYTRRLRMIVVDRAAGAQALRKLCKDVKARLAEGRSVIIFPEGTRTAPGDVIEYQPGIAALYGLGLPVVPAATNSGVCWGRNRWYKKPGTIVLEFLPMIPAGLPREEFMKQLQTKIETKSQELLAVQGEHL